MRRSGKVSACATLCKGQVLSLSQKLDFRVVPSAVILAQTDSLQRAYATAVTPPPLPYPTASSQYVVFPWNPFGPPGSPARSVPAAGGLVSPRLRTSQHSPPTTCDGRAGRTGCSNLSLIVLSSY